MRLIKRSIILISKLLFIGILVLTNDKFSDVLPFNAVPYLCMTMFLNSIIGFIINKNNEKDM